jgi:hypothetical protein
MVVGEGSNGRSGCCGAHWDSVRMNLPEPANINVGNIDKGTQHLPQYFCLEIAHCCILKLVVLIAGQRTLQAVLQVDLVIVSTELARPCGVSQSSSINGNISRIVHSNSRTCFASVGCSSKVPMKFCRP